MKLTCPHCEKEVHLTVSDKRELSNSERAIISATRGLREQIVRLRWENGQLKKRLEEASTK